MSTADVVAQRNVLPAPAKPASMSKPTTSSTITTAPTTVRSTAITFASPQPRKRLWYGDDREDRTSKIRPKDFEKTMEPPVLSFYGEKPVPLPSRFGHLKRKLVAGHEAALEASWGRLIAALGDEMKHIESRGTNLIPTIDFGEIDNSAKVAPFCDSLKRYGIGVIRAVVAGSDAEGWVNETKKYLETKHEFKAPPAQDPTCFDFFWSPCQVRARAHPKVLRAQKFAMSLWETEDDDRMATRFPITYADRIRIDTDTPGNLHGTGTNTPVPEHQLPSTSTLIAQVDNGSLERWETDGYGRSGCYDAIWRGEWEKYNPWDPTGRVNATMDLYNGMGACSMFRMFQGILALTTVEPGMVCLLPSPQLSTAYFLLRPFFSPKKGPLENGEDSKAWEEYLDASNWALDKEQTTIIHGAVPGHAQRVTELWHPHLRLRTSLVAPPTLRPGDYIVWHPDEPYAFERTSPTTSMLVYTPAAPLTQTNALFLARQRKAFQRGYPGPDFDSTGSSVFSEAPHTGRLEEKDIAEVGGEEGLQAMGLAPWILKKGTVEDSKAVTPTEEKVEDDVAAAAKEREPSASAEKVEPKISAAEAEVVRLANIILFPDRYDFWMPSRTGTPSIDVSKKDNNKDKGKGKEVEK